MNTYDPRDSIVYRHLDQRQDPFSAPLTSASPTNPLPSGYANGSPRTYLGSRRMSTAA